MKIKRGDIIEVNQNIKIDLGAHVQIPKDRPYMVISNNMNNLKAPTINIAAISSHIEKRHYPMHCLLKKKKYPNLKCDSIILAEQILTIDKSYINKIIGHLDAQDICTLNQALAVQILGIGDENYETLLSSACTLN